jgi:membrane protein YqaA with SNARE-associated domain
MKAFLATLKAWGPFGAFVIAMIDSGGLPNPGGTDYLLLFLAWVQPETAFISAACAVAGSLIGSYFLFSLARKGGQLYLDKHASGPRAMRFRAWFDRYGLVTVFIPGLVPVIPLPMKIFTVSAGALGVRPVTFMGVMGAARAVRYFGLAWLGKELGENSTAWLVAHKLHFALGAVALLVFCVVLVRLADRRRHGGGQIDTIAN